jgi:hypothetical protein
MLQIAGIALKPLEFQGRMARHHMHEPGRVVARSQTGASHARINVDNQLQFFATADCCLGKPGCDR